jgi:hypothetical protein
MLLQVFVMKVFDDIIPAFLDIYLLAQLLGYVRQKVYYVL